MTTTVYIATYTDSDGKKFYGSIRWDKYTPRRLNATICPHVTETEVDYPVWTQNSSYGRTGLEALVKKMKAKAAKMALALVSEEETAFRVK